MLNRLFLLLLLESAAIVISKEIERISVGPLGKQTEMDMNDTTNEDPQPHPNSMTCQFENKSGQKVLLWWDDGREGVLQAELENDDDTMINTFVGHEFYFTTLDKESGELYRAIMNKYVASVTLLPPEEMQQQNKEFQQQKTEWLRNYYEKAGQPWRNYYPRGAVEHFMFNITYIGQRFESTSHHPRYEICPGVLVTDQVKEQLRHQQSNESNMSMYQNEHHVFVQDKNSNRIWCRKTTSLDKKTWQQKEELYTCLQNDTTARNKWDESDEKLELVVVCDEPRVIRIDNFLSEDECDHVIQVGKAVGLKRSTISEEALETEDRTSSTCWLERDHSPILDNIVRRIGDVVRIHPSKLFINVSSESLQLVHYKTGELYKAHLDYGTDKPNQRFLTFLMYLNSPESGGNTSFPNAASRCRDADDYFGVRPKKGTAVFFYDLFADGNADPSSLHIAEPPLNGSEKWMTNLWIWDPYFG